jgi:hypothetical protein
MRKIALIAVCLTLGVAGVAAAATLLHGTTSQNLSIALRLKGNTLDMQYKANYNCSDGGHPSTPQPTTVSGIVLHNGSWSGGETVGKNDHVHTSGHLTAHGAAGNFKETYLSKGKHTCKSGLITFSVR